MKCLDIKSCQKHLLAIAEIFDKICNKHHIPYYMIGGTFLGAIRHKGFIPWDDDMDFGVPIDRYDELMTCLHDELISPYRLCTFKTVQGCASPFAKIDDYSTVIEDKCQNIPLQNQLGLNIDIFPLCMCEKGDIKNKKLQRLRFINSKIFTESTSGSRYKHFIKSILRSFFPISQKKMLAKIWSQVQSINNGPYLANLFGLVGERELLPLDFWGAGKRYEFEHISLTGPEKHDEFLTQIYGDYMKLPPVEKRKTHSANVYYRKDFVQ